MAAVLGRVHGHDPRDIRTAGELLGGTRDEPVVRMHEIEVVLGAERTPELEHVRVHRVDPAHERLDVALGIRRLAHSVHGHAMTILGRAQPSTASRQYMHLEAVANELFGQLPHVTRKSAFDDRRVLPGQQQDPHARAQPIGPAA